MPTWGADPVGILRHADICECVCDSGVRRPASPAASSSRITQASINAHNEQTVTRSSFSPNQFTPRNTHRIRFVVRARFRSEIRLRHGLSGSQPLESKTLKYECLTLKTPPVDERSKLRQISSPPLMNSAATGSTECPHTRSATRGTALSANIRFSPLIFATAFPVLPARTETCPTPTDVSDGGALLH